MVMILVQEFTCTLCGFSTRDSDELKAHMKDRHNRIVDNKTFSFTHDTGTKEVTNNVEGPLPKDVGEEVKDDAEETLDEMYKVLPEEVQEQIETMVRTSLSRCMFCGKDINGFPEMIAHIMKDHKEHIDMMKGSIVPPDGNMDFNSLIGNLGEMTSIIMKQLGDALGSDKGDVNNIFSAFVPQEDLTGEDEEMEFPDIKGIMEVAMNIGLDSPDVLGDDEVEGEDGGETLVRECRNCGNFIKIDSITCPFCGKETGD